MGEKDVAQQEPTEGEDDICVRQQDQQHEEKEEGKEEEEEEEARVQEEVEECVGEGKEEVGVFVQPEEQEHAKLEEDGEKEEVELFVQQAEGEEEDKVVGQEEREEEEAFVHQEEEEGEEDTGVRQEEREAEEEEEDMLPREPIEKQQDEGEGEVIVQQEQEEAEEASVQQEKLAEQQADEEDTRVVPVHDSVKHGETPLSVEETIARVSAMPSFSGRYTWNATPTKIAKEAWHRRSAALRHGCLCPPLLRCFFGSGAFLTPENLCLIWYGDVAFGRRWGCLVLRNMVALCNPNYPGVRLLVVTKLGGVSCESR